MSLLNSYMKNYNKKIISNMRLVVVDTMKRIEYVKYLTLNSSQKIMHIKRYTFPPHRGN